MITRNGAYNNKLEVLAELKVNNETWVLEKIESAMFKDDMRHLLKTRENFFLTFPVSTSDLSSFFNKLEEKREYCLIVSLIRGFNEPELVHARRCFHSLESLKTPKKTLGGSFSSNLVS